LALQNVPFLSYPHVAEERFMRRPAAFAASAASLALASPASAFAQAPAETGSAQHARELVELAIHHEEIPGAAYSHAKAYDLYCEAARLDDPDALLRMGWMYARGRGRPRDDAIAETLFRRAAGVASARDKLPECLRKPYQPLTQREPLPVDIAPEQALAQPTRLQLSHQPPARSPQAAVGSDRRKLERIVTVMAREFRLDPRLVLAVIRVESNFDPAARSPKNAQGLMQLIPETAERFAVRDVLDPTDNLRGGMSYLRWLLSYFRGDVALALAGYNAGERAVDRHRGVPPYAETLAYVQRIRTLYPHDRHPFDANLTAASAWLPRLPRAAQSSMPMASGN
jgi:soluble lytic murein transglycosylase-like protein